MSFDEISVFDYVGGAETFRKLVDIFYERVEADEELRAIFPEDLEPGKIYQYQFLIQYWGGPNTYSTERGHPRLRMRHMPYTITPALSDRWVAHMHYAIDAVEIQEPARTVMRDYFTRGASFMVNKFEASE